MDLYVIRHADAMPIGERGISSDEERPLSPEGEAQCRALAAALQRQGVRLDRVLTSPLVRARQTADIMLQAWSKPTPELESCAELAPGIRPGKLARALRKLGEASVALVGHQPDLSDWTAWLIGSRKARLDFAKSGVAYVVCNDPPDKGAGTLTWLLTPEWLAGK